MITFSREGTKLKITAEVKTTIAKRFYPLSWECNDEIHAELLAQNLEEHLKERLMKARREAYDDGWKDAKAKRAKETWFASWL